MTQRRTRAKIIRPLSIATILVAALGGCPGLLGPSTVTEDATVLVILTGIQERDEVDLRIGNERREFTVAAGQAVAEVYVEAPSGVQLVNLEIVRGDDQRCAEVEFALETDSDDGIEVLSFDYRFLSTTCETEAPDGGDSEQDAGDGDDGGVEPEDDGGEEPEDDGGVEPEDDGGEEPEDDGGVELDDDGGVEPEDDGGVEQEDGGGAEPEEPADGGDADDVDDEEDAGA